MREKLSNLYAKDGTKAVLSSLISIVIGLVVGSIIILLVGMGNPSLGLSSAWDGIAWCSADCFPPAAARREH